MCVCVMCIYICIPFSRSCIVSDVSYELKQHTLNARQKLLKFEKREVINYQSAGRALDTVYLRILCIQSKAAA